MAMGEAGRHSRAVAPLYGSKIGYAPVRPRKRDGSRPVRPGDAPGTDRPAGKAGSSYEAERFAELLRSVEHTARLARRFFRNSPQASSAFFIDVLRKRCAKRTRSGKKVGAED